MHYARRLNELYDSMELVLRTNWWRLLLTTVTLELINRKVKPTLLSE